MEMKHIVLYAFKLLLLVALLLPRLGNAQGPAGFAPITTEFNYSVDIKGDPDPRVPGSDAGFVDSQFLAVNVPVGTRLHITHVTGDVVAWITGLPQPGSKAGILWGLKPNVPDVSAHWSTPGASDVCFLYVQGALSSNNDVIRIPVDQQVNSYLDDNILISRLSAWMNTTGVPIHMEATFKLTYFLEPIAPLRRPLYMEIWAP